VSCCQCLDAVGSGWDAGLVFPRSVLLPLVTVAQDQFFHAFLLRRGGSYFYVFEIGTNPTYLLRACGHLCGANHRPTTRAFLAGSDVRHDGTTGPNRCNVKKNGGFPKPRLPRRPRKWTSTWNSVLCLLPGQEGWGERGLLISGHKPARGRTNYRWPQTLSATTDRQVEPEDIHSRKGVRGGHHSSRQWVSLGLPRGRGRRLSCSACTPRRIQI